MIFGTALANRLWVASAWSDWRRFRAALRDPAQAQREVLRGIVARSGGTPALPGALANVVPRDWDQVQPLVDRAAAGERGVLTRERIARFEPTSGSSAAVKLIPSTPLLRAQFNRAIHPWIFDLYSRNGSLLDGTAYWSVSPVVRKESTSGGIAVGFEEDRDYLGFLGKLLIDRAMAVPGDVRHLPIAEFQRATLLFLLAQPSLRLISVWNPTFLARLMEYFEANGESLRRALADGVEVCGRRLRHRVPEQPWPHLRLISCWTDGHARSQVGALRQWFPETEIQPKGLMATEAFVSLPFSGHWPLAIRSHYLEFEFDDGRLLPVEELREGDEARVIVTTGGGLIRYRLGDRIVVTDFLCRTPCIRFLGRQDLVSDLCGEKLSEAFVGNVLRRLGMDGFSLLAPDGMGYTLYAAEPPAQAALETALAQNIHYRWAVEVGQLRPVRCFRVAGHAAQQYVEARRRQGQRLGDIKTSSLARDDGWSDVFDGHYVSDSQG